MCNYQQCKLYSNVNRTHFFVIIQTAQIFGKKKRIVFWESVSFLFIYFRNVNILCSVKHLDIQHPQRRPCSRMYSEHPRDGSLWHVLSLFYSYITSVTSLGIASAICAVRLEQSMMIGTCVHHWFCLSQSHISFALQSLICDLVHRALHVILLLLCSNCRHVQFWLHKLLVPRFPRVITRALPSGFPPISSLCAPISP